MAAIFGESLTSSVSIPIIDRINYKLEGKIEAHTITPSMFSESLFAGNQSIFEDLNIIQLGINKTDGR